MGRSPAGDLCQPQLLPDRRPGLPGAFPLPKALSELIHPDDLPPAGGKRSGRGCGRGSAVEHTHRISMDGGRTWRWWYIRAIQVEYNTKAPVMLVTAVDISGFKETERRQAQQIRRLQTALGQTSKRLWGGGPPRRRILRLYPGRDLPPPGEGRGPPSPDDLIEGGAGIHPGSVGAVPGISPRSCWADGPRASATSLCASGDAGCYSWASVSYRTLFDEAGRAVQAVGVLEELPQGLTGRGRAGRRIRRSCRSGWRRISSCGCGPTWTWTRWRPCGWRAATP